MSSGFASDIEFNKLLKGRDDIDLVRLMLEFAADAYPNLDETQYLAEIHRLGCRARDRVTRLDPGEGSLRRQLESISELLYAEEGFHGNEGEYYDPRNSYLNEVLSRRCGIPISLGIVYLSVAAEAGVLMYGIGTPGHFVLGASQESSVDGSPFEPAETLYVDPFTSGAVLNRDACIERVEHMLGQEGVLDDEHLRPASSLDIGTRVLRNLKAAYVMENDWSAVLPVQQRLTMLLPDAPEERRDLGLMYLRTGQGRPALDLLEPYAKICDAEQSKQLQPYIRSAWRLIAELN
jgi:regulator of sirC expression with transglutaminase-like and TPR domain